LLNIQSTREATRPNELVADAVKVNVRNL